MSIEKSGSAGAAKVVSHGGHVGVKGRHGAAATDDAAAASPFALMLTALDGEATALQSGLPVTVDAVGVGTTALATDPALALLQDNASALPVGLSPAELAPTESAKGRATPGVKGLADVSGRADRAGDAVQITGAAESAKRQAEALARDDKLEAAADKLGTVTPTSSLSARAMLVQDVKNGRELHGVGDDAWRTATSQLLAVATELDTRAGGGDRATAKAGSSLGTLSSEGGWGSSGWFRDAQTATGAPGGVTQADGTAPSPDQFVAEQVNYWVSQNVQNAQLKLDGLGADKVEVSIAMNGNEAQVDFRTDQPETRSMLEAAVSQLKDMLSREGVVLSGVSVGTSSSQHGEQQRQARQQASGRQGKAEILVPVTDVATTKTNRVAGRALDLFV